MFRDRLALEPLVHLRAVDIHYPMLNARLIAYTFSAVPPPRVERLVLVLRSNSNRLHECLHAAGAALRTLELTFPAEAPRDLRLGHVMTAPLKTNLHVLHLSSPHRDIFAIAAHLLSLVRHAPHLEVLIIEIEAGDTPVDEVSVEELERVLDALPALSCLRIHTLAEWHAHIPMSLLDRAGSVLIWHERRGREIVVKKSLVLLVECQLNFQ
ncbi:hypothetical protein B0H17DRAFT_1214544 [Mycena rosella]|uniref:Uncharacterized protein n=1 Tax=Mycena rosella TaxID=1033263 RepID=A0AAD7CMS0_MYCRO|nr:hypothetical protein B0H17DRAFT_1214544 [Mycena rosella]